MEAFPASKELQEQTEALDQEFEDLMKKEFAKWQNNQAKLRRSEKKKRRTARKKSQGR